MKNRYEINAPVVSGEIIDGEAIIMHLGLGHYFSAEGSGALIWAGVEQRADPADIAQALAGRYGIELADAESAVDGFLSELAGHDLVRETDAPAGTVDPQVLGAAAAEYAPPSIQVYTDMQDLLLLDPIHDVDAVGWPVPATHTSA